MIETLKAAILDYEREGMTNPTYADPTRLERYIEEAEQDLEETEMGREAVHNAFGLYLILRDRERTLEILETYLTQKLPPDEEAWVRWNHVDTLALLRRCAEVVVTHKSFLSWAKANLTADRLPWVMWDATQAFCWFSAGRGDDWIEIFREITDAMSATDGNRYHRFGYHRCASAALAKWGRPSEALPMAEEMLRIAQEDPEWKYRLFAEMSAYAAFIAIHEAAGEAAKVRSVADRAVARLNEFVAGLPGPETLDEIAALSPADGLDYRNEFAQRDPVIAYRGASHNLGAVLYRAKEYKLALPLFERAMAYRFLSQYLAKCYAACLWVTSRDKSKLGAFIEHASPVFGRSRDWWKEVPELEGVRIGP